MKKGKIAFVLGLILLISIAFSGCLNGTNSSGVEQTLVGTWESGVVDDYWIHQKILRADGSFTSRWLYESDRSVYSTVSGTWSADSYTLTTITDHTDTYAYTLTGTDTMNLQWDGESRIYYR